MPAAVRERALRHARGVALGPGGDPVRPRHPLTHGCRPERLAKSPGADRYDQATARRCERMCGAVVHHGRLEGL